MADEKKGEKAQQKPQRERGGKKGQPAAQAAAPAAEAKPREPEPKLPARLRLRYEQEIVPMLMRELKIENKMRVPRLQKIVINMALGEARENAKILDAAAEEIRVITGQNPIVTRAR
jgi:large subunit ribosomal protein L5